MGRNQKLKGNHMSTAAAGAVGYPPVVQVTDHKVPPTNTGEAAMEGQPPAVMVRENIVIEVPGLVIPFFGETPTAAEPHPSVPSQEDTNSATAESLTEQQKYELMWKHENYRAVAPGESVSVRFLDVAKPKYGTEIIDFGAGTGRGALMLALLGGLKVRMLDFASNCLDDEVRQSLTTQAHALSFEQHDLTQPITGAAPLGYCTDVMEHIPPEDVDKVLKNILQAAQHVFFQISTVDDVCGAAIGHPLHLSVHDYTWWHQKLRDDFQCHIHWSEDHGDACLFYVTAWPTGEDVVKAGILNIDEDTIRANVKQNLADGWQQVQPHEPTDRDVIILGGGPSLDAHLSDIRRMREAGAALITMNGAYHWALEHELVPSAQIVVDARPFNARFTHPVVENCRYLIGSQVAPETLAGLPADRTWLWHTTAEVIRDLLNEDSEKTGRPWFGIPGGCTVLLRAIPLLRMLGYRHFHLFGCDSCLLDDKHHAYGQPENDGQLLIPAIIGGRTFTCQPWHVAQGEEFMRLIRMMGDQFELEVYGDGLLAWILKHGAQLDIEAEEAQEASESATQLATTD
ncbi:MAG: DUF115 domain-containing protein [Patescibacteria group bacterium]|nr:DUF115 domain-containing protein [Patescibacteria group bacterium]